WWSCHPLPDFSRAPPRKRALAHLLLVLSPQRGEIVVGGRGNTAAFLAVSVMVERVGLAEVLGNGPALRHQRRLFRLVCRASNIIRPLADPVGAGRPEQMLWVGHRLPRK